MMKQKRGQAGKSGGVVYESTRQVMERLRVGAGERASLKVYAAQKRRVRKRHHDT